jgi:hypothetical protein
MRSLKLNQLYSRQEVHSVFSPETKFTPQAGTWGLQGIVKVPDREGDVVFFVTYGQQQGSHDFDEGISGDGVLRWQSQPKQALDNPIIHQLIVHDETRNNIHLFLRENKKEDYAYLGRLKYLAHDAMRERPVYFQWQLLDWSQNDSAKPNEDSLSKTLKLTTQTPSVKKTSGISSDAFRKPAKVDYAAKDKKNRDLGLAGELLVLEYERALLLNAGLADLAEKVAHVSVDEGDGAGYDIKSFTPEGSVKYIEVKTTNGGVNTDFFMSPNELKFAESNPYTFYLYRVFNFKSFPELLVETYVTLKHFEAIPTEFRMQRI